MKKIVQQELKDKAMIEIKKYLFLKKKLRKLNLREIANKFGLGYTTIQSWTKALDSKLKSQKRIRKRVYSREWKRQDKDKKGRKVYVASSRFKGGREVPVNTVNILV